MKPLTADHIRESMVNTTSADLARMPVPGLYETLWDEREYLGWRDRATLDSRAAASSADCC